MQIVLVYVFMCDWSVGWSFIQTPIRVHQHQLRFTAFLSRWLCISAAGFFLFEAISHISGQEELLEWHMGEERRCEGGKKLFSHKGQVPIWKRQV